MISRWAEREISMLLTLLCLKWEPRIVRLNSPTLETTKLAKGFGPRDNINDNEKSHLVPRSVQLINWDDFGSLIILCAYVIQVSSRTYRRKAPKICITKSHADRGV